MLLDVIYVCVFGISVLCDFVELFSQFYEYWFEVFEVFVEFVMYVEMGEFMFKDLLDCVLGVVIYDIGFVIVEYVVLVIVDLELYCNLLVSDLIQVQMEIFDCIGLLYVICMCYVLLYFVYVFGSEYYVSSYYCYMWVEVMDVDVFEVFEEVENVFDVNLVVLFEVNIFSKGGIVDVVEFYICFCGWFLGVEVLLKGCGLFDVVQVI